MRSLTRSQATVLLTLLGAGTEPERRREEGSGLARTTYQDAKRKLYAAGCVEDRYLPHPALLGLRSVRFTIARPFAEKLGDQAAAWAARPDAVVVWKGAQSVFGAFFEGPAAGREGPTGLPRAAAEKLPASLAPQEVSLRVDPASFALPVYFDYEGALSRFTGLWVPRGYPRPFGGPLVNGYARHLPWGFQRHPQMLGDLVRRPFVAEGEGRPGHLLGPSSLPRSQRQLVLSGCVDWRPVPNLERMPPFRGRRLQGIALVHGLLREGQRPADLFHALGRGLRTHPFLYATDGAEVLFGSLLVQEPRRAEVEGGPDRDGAAALDVLRRHLSGIQVVREPFGSLQVLVNHRYDRVLPPVPYS